MLRIVPTDKELYGAAQRAALLPYLTDAVIHHFHLDLDNICFLYLHLCLHHCLIFHLSSHSQKFQLLDSQPSCVPSGKVVVTELSQICTTGLLVIDNNTNKIQQTLMGDLGHTGVSLAATCNIQIFRTNRDLAGNCRLAGQTCRSGTCSWEDNPQKKSFFSYLEFSSCRSCKRL